MEDLNLRKINKISFICESEFKYVAIYYSHKFKKRCYKAYLPAEGDNLYWYKLFQDERKAALTVDKKLIERGLPPVNILKPVN